jgi:hypothetical protein
LVHLRDIGIHISDCGSSKSLSQDTWAAPLEALREQELTGNMNHFEEEETNDEEVVNANFQ